MTDSQRLRLADAMSATSKLSTKMFLELKGLSPSSDRIDAWQELQDAMEKLEQTES
jgi:hypothetical protein